MIIPLEQQVCPLGLARKLKELGAPQETYFAWAFFPDDPELPLLFEGGYECFPPLSYNEERCAAYTVGELGVLMPDGEITRKELVGDEYRVGYHWRVGVGYESPRSYWDSATTEAEARSLLLIALVERGVVKFGEPR